MSYLDRVKKKLAKHGEQFTVTGGTYHGIFRILDASTINSYLEDAEKMCLAHPGLLLITQGDATITLTDTITRDGRTYSVMRVSQHRISGTTVVKVVILA
jgi:uncharacterized protein (DUF1330 family)